ncbi:MAG: CBS domain-containing protein [Chloroflexi bacterium]|nr:CBS domain-containing protein [Chloroflexota bacterium]
MKCALVREWMTPDPIVVSPETTLPEAHRIMTENSIRHLPVVCEGQLVGIVTLGDIRGAEPSGATSLNIWEVNYLLSQLRVDEIMTPRPVTISVDDTLGEAAQLMLKHRIGGLPVVDRHGALAGIITECDIFRLVVEDWLQEAEPAAGI